MNLELLPLDEPSETRTFEKGRFELYRVGPMTLGRASYEPGWRWRDHVGAASDELWCEVEHVGLVLSGRAVASMRDGDERLMEAGQFLSSRRGTTAGSSATSPTCRCTSWARRTTPPASNARSSGYQGQEQRRPLGGPPRR